MFRKVRKDILVCIESGHGIDVFGKCSPDKSYYEWAWCREEKYRIIEILKQLGLQVYDVNPEQTEPGLATRVKRVNAKWKETNKKCIYISLHSNACTNDGSWQSKADYWTVWTSKGQTAGDYLATSIYDAAKEELEKVGKFRTMAQTYPDGDPDYEANFYVIYKSSCPACLCEQLFHDNKANIEWMQTEEGKQTLSNIIVKGIIEYLGSEACVNKFGQATE